MLKEMFLQLTRERLAEIRSRRSAIPEADLLTVFQYVRSGLEDKFGSEIIGESDFTESGEGNAKDAFERLRGSFSERRIISAMIERGGLPNLTKQKLTRLQYEEAIGSVLHDLQGEKTT